MQIKVRVLSLMVLIGMSLFQNTYANTTTAGGWMGPGTCHIKVSKFTVKGGAAAAIKKHIWDNEGHIVSTVHCVVAQESRQLCREDLEYHCSSKARRHFLSFDGDFEYSHTFISEDQCTYTDEGEPELDPQTRPSAIIRELKPRNRNLYEDFPSQLQPGWLLENLPDALSEYINLERFTQWFDGFVEEVLHILDEMSRVGGYWMQQLSDILWKLLVISVVAAVVLMLTPASALAGLAQLAAVALLIISVAGASGINFDKNKLNPAFKGGPQAFLGFEYIIDNQLVKNNDGQVLGSVSVSYQLEENNRVNQHQIFFKAEKHQVVFKIYKNGEAFINKSWAIKNPA
ncbi:MAG TPA: hypothetical protein PKC21_09320 [Oligoflexia bacterium]|nr:hypothetical protein [Oligoflexia bacterium]HMR25538.1 hypothetical protein [Oligoflexia bacterium]